MYFCREFGGLWKVQEGSVAFPVSFGSRQGAIIASAFKDECNAPLKENDFNAFVTA
jgi:hypothetical protein